MSELIIVLLIGAAVTGIVYMLFFDEEMDPAIKRRLQQVKKREFNERTDSDEIFKALEKREKLKKSNIIEMLRDQSDYRILFLGQIFSRFKYTEKVKHNLKKADLKIPVDVFFMIVGGLMLPFLMLAILNNNPLFIAVALIFGAIPFFYLKMKFNKRLNMFSQQFPDALGVITNSLRAGHSLLAAFQMVASENPYPINRVFKTVSDEISLGREIRDALEDMTNQLPGSQDLKFFITAVLIQKEIGGNLAEILDTLNNTIRERYKLLGLIKTQTAQAQLSGIVLGLAPVAITALVSLLNPKYMEPLFNTAIGNVALFGAFFMSFMGFMIIQKITKIRV
jgi:tight adherence protein B